MSAVKKHIDSFGYAWNGIVWSVTNQSNYKIHLFLSIVAFLLCFLLKVSYEEFLVIVLLIFLGLTVETVNTAIEKTLDAIDKNYREEIKIAKDVAAGAMLLISIGSFTVAALIFLPKLAKLLAQ